MLAPVTPHRLQANGRPFAHIAQFHPELTALRRDLHAHPELGYEEVYTSRRIQEALKLCGVDEVHTGIGKTGVVGVIKGRTDTRGRMIGLRADMDALTMTEQNEFAWKSAKAGMMHGCGHDGHVTMLVGAARYLAEDFAGSFQMECEAMKRVREDMGLTNVEIMVPFVRTLKQAEKVIALLAKNGLVRGENGLRLIMMCEVPSNAILADEFLEYFDGFSIGSNDLTQLTLGLDRDSGLVAAGFDERDPAVMALLERAISACKAQGKYVGICGQGPSDHPDLAQWLMERGISSISLNPDTVVPTWQRLGGLK